MLNGEAANPTLPAVADRSSDCDIYLTIQEVKYHSSETMLAAVGNKVGERAFIVTRLALFHLMVDLQSGEFRALTSEEVLTFSKASTRQKKSY